MIIMATDVTHFKQTKDFEPRTHKGLPDIVTK